MVLGNSMLIPALPVLQKAMDISNLQTGLLITLFSLPAAIAIPFLGFLADRVGRKTIIVPSLLVYGIGGLICGISALLMDRPYMGMVIGRIIQGFGGAGTAPIAMTLTSDLFTENERSQAMGINEAANGFGKVLSPILGSIFVMISWYFLFFVYAVISFPVAIAVYFFVKEEVKGSKSGIKEYFHGVMELMKNKKWSFLSCLSAGAAAFFTLFGILSYVSDILETDYGIKGIYKGLLIAIPVSTMSVTSFINGVMLKGKKSFKLTIVSGLIILGTAMTISIFIKNISIFMVLLGVMGFGVGLVLPSLNTLITSSVPVEKRCSVTAVYGSIRFIGVAIGPPVFNYFLSIDRWIMLVVPAAISFLALIFCAVKLNQDIMLEYRN
ncbi:MAG: MFS transporter [Thermoanaerobacteraceae bacterium]|nr:MFS transporter [Thermoanaerobacteraceae bacterium]